jgi:hypothetical protein
MQRVQHHTQHCVETNDVNKNDRIPEQRQKKYGMHNNGDHGDHDRRKVVSVGTMTNLFTQCEATPLLAFTDSVLANGHKIDDLMDAASLSLKTAAVHFKTASKGLGNVVPEGQSVCVFAVDPGTRNFALCVSEVSRLDAENNETYVTVDNEVKKHKVEMLHFRIMRWMLIDLIDHRVKADFKGPSPVYHRLVRDNVTASAYDEKKVARAAAKALKKAAASVIDLAAEEDGEVPPAPKKRKRAIKEEGAEIRPTKRQKVRAKRERVDEAEERPLKRHKKNDE